MEGSGQDHLPLEGMSRDVIRDIRNGVRAETAAAGDFQSFTVSDGRRIGRLSGVDYWSFAAPLDPSTAPTVDSPGTIVTPDGRQSAVSVVAVGDESLTLAVEDELGDALPRAEVTLDPADILRRLSERLADLEAGGGDITLIEELVSPWALAELSGEHAGETSHRSLPNADEEQERAAEMAVEPGVRFTWGPPGTGKTRVLGRAVGIAARRGDDVLVLAHANAAVDVAAARIAQELDGEPMLDEGRVLRVGNVPTRAPELAQVLPEHVVEEQYPGLIDKLSILEGERRELSDQIRTACDPSGQLAERLSEVRNELKRAERARREAIGDAMDEASVLVTTLSRAIVDDRLWDRDWDVVMVDEASMAPLAMVLALALRGPTTLSLLGDPRQLPPVHRSEEAAAVHWFGRDVFDYGGVTAGDHDLAADQRLCALRIQFRMGETICAAVDELAYKGMLRTHPTARDRGIRLAEALPAQSDEVVVVDTSSLGTRCWLDPEPGSYSRINPMSGALAVTTAAHLRDSGCESVALVSPYRSQVKWMSALAHGMGRVTASTVHRLQGGEADGVILDLTDAAPMDRPSRLTNHSELAVRLLTVAVSRARGKLIVLVDRSFVHERVPLGGPMRLLLDAAASVGAAEFDAVELLRGSAGSADQSQRPFDWLDEVVQRGVVHDGPQSWSEEDGGIVVNAHAEGAPSLLLHGERVAETFRNDIAGSCARGGDR